MANPCARVRIRTTANPPPPPAGSEPCPVAGEVLEALKTARFVCVPIEDLKAAEKRVRKSDKAQFNAIKGVIGRFGLVMPVLVDADYRIVDGHVVWEAAKALGYKTIPVAILEDLSEAEIKTLRIALHRAVELGSFDAEVLKIDMDFIVQADPLLLDFTGFTMPQIDTLTLPDLKRVARKEEDADEPQGGDAVVSREDDLWLFEGGHRLLCSNSRVAQSYVLVLGDLVVQMVLSDPPYGVKIAEVVSKARHGEFLEGSDMSASERRQFFQEFLAAMAPVTPAGCIVDLFMDHRGLSDLLNAVEEVGLELLCIPTWDKNPGMGGLYRIASEFVVVAKKPGASHINNIQLGRHGRNRTTIWRAPGLAGFGQGRDEALASHPTRKPVSLLSEAILDTSHRGGVILDPFAGSGSTLVAAHRMGRIGVGIELDPKFVDVAVRRLELATGEPARHDLTGRTFAETAAERQTASVNRAA